MPEVEFSDIRRTAMSNRVERCKSGIAPRVVCGICGRPIYLSRYVRTDGNRWFEHDGAAPDCPWYSKNRLSPELRRALIYRGQQEGERHRHLKNFVADWLEREPGVSDVNREQVTFGQILKGEWKRPDVQCVWRGRRVVFEIQLSYTFLSEVIKRDEFYRKEGIFIIWLFDTFDLRRATVRDEAFFNRRNLFILDKEAEEVTKQAGRLTLNGTFQEPVIVEQAIADEWRHRLITLDDLHFEQPSYRPYFVDYDAALQALQERRAEIERQRIAQQREAARLESIRLRQKELSEWNNLVQRYIRAAIAYCDSDYADATRQPILDAADDMYETGFWHRGFECLKDDAFFGWHRPLPVLLSMRFNRPVGYSTTHCLSSSRSGGKADIAGRILRICCSLPMGIIKVPNLAY
ncbi:MAG: hypothetical protein JWQ07_5159 [Ramlibacter sp.]|nr:hypothetical protein [Ramlibacter sp.]